MSQGRTLPLLGPAVVLYLLVELISSARGLDGAALVLATAAVCASLLPFVLVRQDDVHGARRVGGASVALAVGLLAVAQPGLLSLPIELAGALAWPWVGALAVDLALDTPDRPPGLQRASALRGLSYAAALVAAALGALAVLPAIEVDGGALLAPPSLARAPLAVSIAQLGTALAIRVARRRLGSAPEALASNGGALLGIGFAVACALAALAVPVLAPGSGSASAIARGLACAGGIAFVVGHLAMLDARRPIRAALASRRVSAAVLACGGLAAAIGALADRLPGDRAALAVTAAAFLASGAVAYRVARALVDGLSAPDAGRLLRALEESERASSGARTIEEIASAVLPPLRRASRAEGARPLIQTLAPARQAGIDAAGMPRIEARELAASLRARLEERPGEIVVLAPLRALVVRRPDLRALVDALEQLEALCAVPIASSGELEGALIVPRGRRRAPLTLEEMAALEQLARRLSAPLAALQAEARAQERAGRALRDVERHEERIDALEDELARLRADARILKAGRAADRLAAPAIAYSPAMRALVARVGEVAGVDAPVQLVAEGGTAVDQIGHLVHAASPSREGPFVIADCAAVRPERSAAALFGDEGEAGAHPGWLRLASGGTLLLVDAPALSLEAQAALAEAIASRTARAEGGASSYPVDVRLIAHARIEVTGLARLGAFDPELARRLEPLRLDVPSLRERREDLPSLVLLALDRACRTLGRAVLGIDDAAIARLTAYDWPGNLRELQSVIDRAVAHAEPPRVRAEDLPPLAVADQASAGADEAMPAGDPLDGTWNEIELRILRAAMERAGGNKSEAARMLGLKRTTFLDKLRRAGIEVRDSIPPMPLPLAGGGRGERA